MSNSEVYMCAVSGLRCFLTTHCSVTIELDDDIDRYLIKNEGINIEDIIDIVIKNLYENNNLTIFFFDGKNRPHSSIVSYLLSESILPALLIFDRHVICIVSLIDNNITFTDQHATHTEDIRTYFMDKIIKMVIFIENEEGNSYSDKYTILHEMNCGQIVYRKGKVLA